LNFAIEGDGWFQLQSPQGVLLTRDGSFEIDRQGRLVSMQGWPVLMDSDARITSTDLSLRADGELWVDGARAGQLALAKADPASLQVAGPNLFRAASATIADAGAVTVRQGFLEGSNVNALTEMVGLMQTMRRAEASQRAAHAYDEALEMAISTLGEF
jgi:flagellar basal-body rod protein FlgF